MNDTETLPDFEKKVLCILIEANGKPLRAAAIADRLGIQDNHCIKLIKFLTDKGHSIERSYVVINGETKSYKEYWIEPEKKLSQETLDKIAEYEAIRDRYASTSNQIEKINQSIERLKK